MPFQKPITCTLSEKGSMTVLVSLMVPIFALMIILVANIGQLIFEKIRLQNTVDMCALAGATVQSVGMNEIADLNQEMFIEHHKLEGLLESGVWYDKGEAGEAVDFFYNGSTGVLDYINRYQEEANHYYAQKTWEFALKVKDQNLPKATLEDLNEQDKLTELEPITRTLSYHYYDKSCSSCDKKTTYKWSDPDDPRYEDRHDGKKESKKRRKRRKKGETQEIPELVKKVDRVYVYYKLSQPAKEFSLGKSLFKAMPELTAKAEAKPNEGHTENRQPYYQARLSN